MAAKHYEYVIVGGGLAAASAIDGIRELDSDGSILLVSAERHLPYHRPPLSKKLWLGKKKVEEIFVQDQGFYDDKGVELALGTRIVALDVGRKIVTDSRGREMEFGKCLLATGGHPKKLPVSGAEGEGVSYFRYLDDYLAARRAATEGASVLVIGGGFIGSEMAAALCANKVDVTMLYAGRWMCDRVFPEGLGQAMEGRYRQAGIRVLAGDQPTEIARSAGRFVTHTRAGQEVESDLVVIGVGIAPGTELAQKAGLNVEDGIVVDEHLRTSAPNVWAAGDNARFPYQALGTSTRFEHWDNALSQGAHAGRNMAGANEPFTYMPYFFSDLFEFGYEAVGEADARLETFADWQKENDTGVIYYLRDHLVRGAMMCNVWDKTDAARELIRQASPIEPEQLAGAIK